jgi:hypothetical protein
VGWVYEGGLIEVAQNNTEIGGYLLEDAILDEAGRAMAVLELASGPGVPSDFLQKEMYQDPRSRGPGDPGDPHETSRQFKMPAPLGEWSDQDLRVRLRVPGHAP